MSTNSASKYDMTPLMEGLQSPDAYPHRTETIHVVQTHTSCVFLTGEYVYKVKKPVNFGFLDYSTLERRRIFCEQELILNQRVCPDIYLQVLPVTCQHGHLRVGGDGPAVEWALQMHQMREEDMLPARLKADTLEVATIARLAHRLADFHSHAGSDETIRAYGSPDSVAATIALTLNTMQQVTQNTPLVETYQALCGYFTRFQEEQAPLLRDRLLQGHIRDCHGDLRAQNICLDPRFSDGIQIFDCIEFNTSFRYIDTAADIAYLAMDLDLAGHADLRAHLLNVYTREINDSSLSEILPFYLTYRAIVRGNIALLAAQESEVPAAERQAQRDLANAAYDLARSYAEGCARPSLLITVGYSGCGKSVLAWEVCRRLPAVLISSDRLRKERAGTRVTARLEASQYTSEQRDAVYDALRREAAGWLARNENVLLDATFLDPAQRQAAAELAQEYNAAFWILDCQCPDAIIRQRLAARAMAPNASDADLNVYLQQCAVYGTRSSVTQETVSPGGSIPADTTRPTDALAHDILIARRRGSIRI